MGHQDVLIYLKRVVKARRPECVFLMETKVDRARMERVGRSLNFKNSEIVDPNGLAGGLALFWSEDIELECIWKLDRILQCTISEKLSMLKWNLIACYGTPYYKEKRSF